MGLGGSIEELTESFKVAAKFPLVNGFAIGRTIFQEIAENWMLDIIEDDDAIRKIVQTRQLDGQLKESSLNRAELELVIRAFVNVWKRMSHRRIKYPLPTKKTSYPA